MVESTATGARDSEAPLGYLSDGWLTEADRALATLVPVAGPLVVGFRVTGGPGGERRYRLVLGPDRVGAEAGAEGASVTMTVHWDLAVALAQGVISAQRAFLDGGLTVEGDPVVLLGYQDQLAQVDDVLAGLRSRTDFGS